MRFPANHPMLTQAIETVNLFGSRPFIRLLRASEVSGERVLQRLIPAHRDVTIQSLTGFAIHERWTSGAFR